MYRPALLALVLVLALPAASIAAPVDAPAGGETGLLTLGPETTTGFATQSIDVGLAVALQHDAASARVERYALGGRLARTSDDEARRASLFEAVTEARRRSADLRGAERALREAYVDGSIGTGAYLRGLVLLDAEAALLRARVEQLRTEADRVQGVSLRTRLDAVETSLIGIEGPVRDRTAAAARGTSEPIRVYVEGSADGSVLATIDDDRHVREAYRVDRRTFEANQTWGPVVAVALASDLYPVAKNTSRGSSFDGFLGNNLYRVQFQLEQGTLTAYLDSDTRAVFYEVQERRLDELGPSPGVVAAANDTRLVVNRTYPGGPLRIATYDNDTGVPVEATIHVDGDTARTGTDGVVWTLAPPQERFTVTATGPGGNVSTFVRLIAPRPVNGAEG